MSSVIRRLFWKLRESLFHTNVLSLEVGFEFFPIFASRNFCCIRNLIDILLTFMLINYIFSAANTNCNVQKIKDEQICPWNVKKVGFSAIALTAQLAQTANVFLNCGLWTNCLWNWDFNQKDGNFVWKPTPNRMCVFHWLDVCFS